MHFHMGKKCYKEEGDEHTLFEIGGHVQMGKSDLEAQTKSLLLDCTWLERWIWVLILNPLETSNASRESGSFIYYIFSYSIIYIFTFFPFSFSLLSFLLSSFSLFFSFCILPLNSRLHCAYLYGNAPHAWTIAHPGEKWWKNFRVPR
jgi:hypothetical protein